MALQTIVHSYICEFLDARHDCRRAENCSTLYVYYVMDLCSQFAQHVTIGDCCHRHNAWVVLKYLQMFRLVCHILTARSKDGGDSLTRVVSCSKLLCKRKVHV